MRNQFFADAGLAEDQDVGGCTGDRFDLGKHLAERAAAADDPAKVHRDVDLFAKIVALALQFLTELRVLGRRLAQVTLGSQSLGDVLRCNEQPVDVAGGIFLGDGRHQQVQNSPVASHHLPGKIVELTGASQLLQRTGVILAPFCVAVEI